MSDKAGFLERLDERLRGDRILWNDFGSFPTKTFVEGVRLSAREMKRVLGLANHRDYAIEPCCADGFQPGFMVHYIDNSLPGQFGADTVLAVREGQFPKGFNWKDLAEVYMQPRNLELLRLSGVSEPVSDRERYSY